jgi:hypothetical protein
LHALWQAIRVDLADLGSVFIFLGADIFNISKKVFHIAISVGHAMEVKKVS